jgi:hypothetical protein
VRDVLKVKHLKTMDVVITGRDLGGRKNAELSLMRDGELVVIGNCSMIGKPDLAVGDCAEVRFLYLNPGDKATLYQPRLVRARPDKTPAECEWRQTEGCQTSRAVLDVADEPFPEAPASVPEAPPPPPVLTGSGRGPSGRLRNFAAMKAEKLVVVIAELEAESPRDEEAIGAAKTALSGKAVSA